MSELLRTEMYVLGFGPGYQYVRRIFSRGGSDFLYESVTSLDQALKFYTREQAEIEKRVADNHFARPLEVLKVTSIVESVDG